MIDTPGEFVQHRQLYSALTVTAADASVIAILQSVTEKKQTFSPMFASIFAKPVIGIVTKVDLAESEKTSSEQSGNYAWLARSIFLYFFVRGNWNRRASGIFGRLILTKWGYFMPQVRDLSVIDVPGGCVLTSCDISAGFGEKVHDGLRVAPEVTARLTLRVALLEMLASGAVVVAVSDVIGAEMEPTGKRVIAGLKDELIKADLGHIELNGSTEENMNVTQTSVGVLVTGFATKAALKLINVHEAAVLFAFGEPIVGAEVL